MRGSKPGERRGGRQKGTPNKLSRDLKESILEAATKAGGKGGIVEYLHIQATTNAGPFLALLGKVLPLQVNAEHSGGINIVISGSDAKL